MPAVSETPPPPPAGPLGALAALVPEPIARAWAFTRPAHGLAMVAAGVLWDTLTLGRVDDTGTNVVLGLYLVVLGALLAMELRVRARLPMPAWLTGKVEWIALGGQFFLGSLLSAWLILFFRSTPPGLGWGFVSLLGALLLLTELGEDKARRLWLLSPLYFFCAYALALFAIPVATGWLGWGVNLLAATFAAFASTPLAALTSFPLTGEDRPRWWALGGQVASWAALLFALTLGAWLNLIPPVPLAAQHVGVYHDVKKVEGGYALSWERQPFPTSLWRRQDVVFRRAPGDVVHVFSAIFAPGGLALDVVHVWERKDEDAWIFRWEERDRLSYAMKGGREQGFRGWTKKRAVDPGRWRVRVETAGGRELGRVYFDVRNDEVGGQTLRTKTF